MKHLLLTLFLFSTYVLSAQPDWYKNVNHIIDDPYRFDNTFFGLYKKGLNLQGSPISDKMYAKIKRADFDRIWAHPTHDELFETLDVTESNKETFVSYFKQVGSSAIPFYLQVVGEFVVYVGYAAKLLELAEKADATRKSTASDVGALIAPAGKFERRIALSTNDTVKYYVTLINTYHIKVGSEDRRYVVSRSVFAVQVE